MKKTKYLVRVQLNTLQQIHYYHDIMNRQTEIWAWSEDDALLQVSNQLNIPTYLLKCEQIG